MKLVEATDVTSFLKRHLSFFTLLIVVASTTPMSCSKFFNVTLNSEGVHVAFIVAIAGKTTITQPTLDLFTHFTTLKKRSDLRGEFIAPIVGFHVFLTEFADGV